MLNKQTELIGDTAPIREVKKRIEIAAKGNFTVLIRGETGVGKEVAAYALHKASARGKYPFVPVDCPAITESLAESELFGHEKGAFTGADRRKSGPLADADGGTLFLDEIGDMTAGLQSKLLRFLNGDIGQRREIRLVGSSQGLTVDVRVIAATNQHLETLVDGKKFRNDLFHRLNVFTISIPPLRDRREDIPLLAAHFTDGTRISETAVSGLQKHDWPGNVRELRNVLEAALAMARFDGRDEIFAEDLALPNQALIELPPLSSGQEEFWGFSRDISMKTYLEKMEVKILRSALQKSQGNMHEAARLINMSREAAMYRMAKYPELKDFIRKLRNSAMLAKAAAAS